VLLHIGALSWAGGQSHPPLRPASLWYRLLPRTRLLCVVLLVFAIALTPHGRWSTWWLYGAGVGAIVHFSHLSPGALAKRVAVEFLFISALLLGTLFQPGGTPLWQSGGVQITTLGLTVLGSVAIKALLSLWALNTLILTTTIPDLLDAMLTLRVPRLLVAIFAAMVRYIAVLGEEVVAMQRAALARNLMGRDRWQRLVVGNMIGALFVRTYDRAERIHRAMLSRGCIDGLPPQRPPAKLRAHDALALVFTLILIFLGQIL
jgi:cobalt/nickel transport system permease protein